MSLLIKKNKIATEIIEATLPGVVYFSPSPEDTVFGNPPPKVTKCLIPAFNGAIFSLDWKEAL